MKRQGLVAKASKKYKATTDSDPDRPVAPSPPVTGFQIGRPNQKWVCDISYLWTSEGRLYLAVVLDLFSRMVVGWAMNKSMKARLVRDALRMVLWRRRMPKGMMVHCESFAIRESMRRAVFEYIEVGYNRTRRHSANGDICPFAFKNKRIA